jgi:hypothetical protein
MHTMLMEEDGGDDTKPTMQSSNVRVVVRVRPMLPSEKRQDLATLLRTQDDNTIVLRHTQRRGQVMDKRFHFDGILDGKKNQMDTYNALKVDSLVQSVIQGYNATVFAYGQTGSGKTYTMEGYDYEHSNTVTADKNARQRPVPKLSSLSQSPDKMGIVPRALSSLFHQVQKEREGTDNNTGGDNDILSIRCTFVQIYNEKVLDLLNNVGADHSTNDGPGLKLRWNQDRGFYAENLYVVEVESMEDALRVFHTGLRG